MGVEVGYHDVLVGLPAAAHHQGERAVGSHCGKDGKLLGLVLDLHHAVEAGVAAHVDVVDAYLAQQAARLLVLHIDVGVAVQHLAEHAPPRVEEALAGTEDGRYDIGGHTAALELHEIVAPKLILDKDGHLGVDQVEKALHVARQVEGHVAHGVDLVVVLAHLVAAGREEGEQDAFLGVAGLDFLYQGPALLKLAERGGVNPNVAAVAVEPFFKIRESAGLPLEHFPGFGIAQGGSFHCKPIGADTYIIKRIHNVVLWS